MQLAREALLAQAQTDHKVLELQWEMIIERRDAMQVQQEVVHINRVMGRSLQCVRRTMPMG